MKAYERREAEHNGQSAYPFFKLARWDERFQAWTAGKTIQATEESCRRLAKKPGRYRISRFEPSGPVNQEPFQVG